ncbi:MAG TPA: O-antigen ligase family protein [Jatrophihabitans sp.]|nr:O-antigen ligase family protein [Jatrophihabitans sp.]
MRERLRGNLTVPAVLVATCLIEALALRSHTMGLVLIGLIAAIALLVIVFRANLKSVALGAAYACAFTLTWNGWFLGPVRPGDLLILITVLLMVVANPGDGFRTPPWWVKQLPIAILLVALFTIWFPPDPIYLANRVVLGASGQPTVDTKGSLGSANLGVAFKFIIAVFALPMAFIGAARIDKHAARRLGIAFAMGAALSGWAATLDHFGANIGHLITKVPNVGSRQLGFTNHPNFLAAGMVLGIPFAFWLLASGNRRERIIGLVSMVGLLGGDYASGSRGGAVCAVLIIGVCVVLHPKTRVHAPTIALAGLFLVGAMIAVVPSLGREILKATRLAGNANTSGSDTVRALVGAQGVRDFRHSPIHGIGLQASFDASQVYLQELASGGLILFAAMQVYMGGAIISAWRFLKRNDMAMALLGSLLAVLALNYFEADLTDRFYYVPAAILVAMMHTHQAETVDEPEVDPADEPGFARADGLPARRRRQPVRS